MSGPRSGPAFELKLLILCEGRMYAKCVPNEF